MFFDSWAGLGRVLLVGVPAYVLLISVLRLSGKRTLAKMNAFDLVVTVALGSTLATILLSADVALAEGVLALALLIGAQFAVAWSAVRSRKLRETVRAAPTLLVWQGAFRTQAARDQRVSRPEVLQAIRSQGMGGLDQVTAVVLEADGSLSVISTAEAGDLSALDDVLNGDESPQA
ncbi:DUF421 domain-containing protein [Amycolatopsis keratiniphila]|uniref:DUF421 domain-containing protein n=1 Tax=Amycolatopsis keratiniphila subsp. keratiniphila TaxID=227715 RepID=A0A1W2LVY3_9PSEU|nr:YetF domain-containing protein [Amycolatopsis keratiniphila]ONF70470.1 hypothetical protein AVR91_0216555 [Amycolatopsis keratiniphila subsp. keratiniphila]